MKTKFYNYFSCVILVPLILKLYKIISVSQYYLHLEKKPRLTLAQTSLAGLVSKSLTFGSSDEIHIFLIVCIVSLLKQL